MTSSCIGLDILKSAIFKKFCVLLIPLFYIGYREDAISSSMFGFEEKICQVRSFEKPATIF